MLDMKIWQKWSNVRSLSCWAFFAEHDMHMTVWMWMWMCIEWHLCYIYIYYEFLLPWEWTKHGGKTTNQNPSKTMPRCQSDFASHAWNSTTWVGRFIGSIQQIVSCETFFWLANLGPSFCQICEKSRVSKFHLKSSPTTKLVNLIENQTISYIYIYKSPVNKFNTVLEKNDKSQDSRPTIYNLSFGNSYLRAGDGDRVRPEAALQEMDWFAVRLLGGLGF